MNIGRSRTIQITFLALWLSKKNVKNWWRKKRMNGCGGVIGWRIFESISGLFHVCVSVCGLCVSVIPRGPHIWWINHLVEGISSFFATRKNRLMEYKHKWDHTYSNSGILYALARTDTFTHTHTHANTRARLSMYSHAHTFIHIDIVDTYTA